MKRWLWQWNLLILRCGTSIWVLNCGWLDFHRATGGHLGSCHCSVIYGRSTGGIYHKLSSTSKINGTVHNPMHENRLVGRPVFLLGTRHCHALLRPRCYQWGSCQCISGDDGEDYVFRWGSFHLYVMVDVSVIYPSAMWNILDIHTHIDTHQLKLRKESYLRSHIFLGKPRPILLGSVTQ